MQVTPEQLVKIAYERKLTSWTADRCADCDYPIKFIFNLLDGDVKFDPGCTCNDRETIRAIRFESSSWQLVTDYINNQLDLEHIKEIKKFWGI